VAEEGGGVAEGGHCGGYVGMSLRCVYGTPVDKSPNIASIDSILYGRSKYVTYI
jgi:hypothetical protein